MVPFILANFTLLLVICIVAFIGGLVMRFAGNAMHRHYTDKFDRTGTPSGWMPVTLQITEALPAGMSRPQRRDWLADKFLSLGLDDEIQMDMGSISPSAQTVEAFVLASRVFQIESALHLHGVRLDPVADRQVH